MRRTATRNTTWCWPPSVVFKKFDSTNVWAYKRTQHWSLKTAMEKWRPILCLRSSPIAFFVNFKCTRHAVADNLLCSVQWLLFWNSSSMGSKCIVFQKCPHVSTLAVYPAWEGRLKGYLQKLHTLKHRFWSEWYSSIDWCLFTRWGAWGYLSSLFKFTRWLTEYRQHHSGLSGWFRMISEVKQRWARLALGWVTSWVHLLTFCLN